MIVLKFLTVSQHHLLHLLSLIEMTFPKAVKRKIALDFSTGVSLNVYIIN